MKRALIGISLDNSSYSSLQLRKAMNNSSLSHFDEIFFLVADTLQIYNSVSKCIDDPDSSSSLDWSITRSQYLNERKTWLSKFRYRLPNWPTNQKWNIIGINEIADKRAFQIHRSVRVLYSIDNLFREDVIYYAEIFAKKSSNLSIYEKRKNLSIEYILEEIAINIRLRVGYGIAEEFYLGKTFELFRNIYETKYSKNHLQLFGKHLPKESKNMSFLFHSWSDKESAWIHEKGITNTKKQSDRVVKFTNTP